MESMGKRPADFTQYPKNDFTVTLLSGLPASGKDTWCQKNANQRPVLSYDDKRKDLKLKHGKKTGSVVHAVFDDARKLLASKTPFIWNATHLSKNMRQPAIDLINQYGARIEILCFESDIKTILSRNNKRDTSLKNDKILQLAKKWEMPSVWEADSRSIIQSKNRPSLKFS